MRSLLEPDVEQTQVPHCHINRICIDCYQRYFVVAINQVHLRAEVHGCNISLSVGVKYCLCIHLQLFVTPYIVLLERNVDLVGVAHLLAFAICQVNICYHMHVSLVRRLDPVEISTLCGVLG